jgi:hypothetical protein
MTDTGFFEAFSVPRTNVSRSVTMQEAGAGPYIAGTLLAIRKVTGVAGLVRGLDRIME